MSGYGSGDMFLAWFGCCTNQATHQRKRHAAARARARIDRSMIGVPTNFQHTVHIGSGDAVQMGTQRLNALQSHMQSKGGYEKQPFVVRAC